MCVAGQKKKKSQYYVTMYEQCLSMDVRNNLRKGVSMGVAFLCGVKHLFLYDLRVIWFCILLEKEGHQ